MNDFLGLLQISNWSTFTIVIYLIISIILLSIIWIKKYSWTIRISIALILGILGGIITLSFNIEQKWSWPTDPGETTAYTEFTLWLSILPTIFVAFMLFFSPFLFFSRITDISLNGNNKKMDKNNILNLTMTIIIAIFISGVLFLLTYYQPNLFSSAMPIGGDDYDSLVDSYPALRENTGFVNWLFLGDLPPYWSIVIIFTIFIISIIFIIIVKYLDNKGILFAKGIKEFILGFQILLEKIVSFISKLLPFVVLSVIPLMFLDSEHLIHNLLSNFIFTVFISISSLAIWFGMSFQKNEIKKKEKSLLVNTVLMPTILVSVIFSSLNKEYSVYALVIMIISIPIVVFNYWTYFVEIEKNEYGDKSEFGYSLILILGTFNIINRIFWYYIVSYCLLSLINNLENYLDFFIQNRNKRVKNV